MVKVNPTFQKVLDWSMLITAIPIAAMMALGAFGIEQEWFQTFVYRFGMPVSALFVVVTITNIAINWNRPPKPELERKREIEDSDFLAEILFYAILPSLAIGCLMVYSLYLAEHPEIVRNFFCQM